MTKRLTILFSQLTVCVKFADIGCDHGFIAKEMLDRNLCHEVVISDISKKSLQKAVDLLSAYPSYRVTPIVSDGFKNLPDDIDQALIAGMGGEEIVHILNSARYLPQRLVLQPMKNSEKVRSAVLSLGYGIVADFTIKDDKFYDIIVCSKGLISTLSKDDLTYGRDNLRHKNGDFTAYVLSEIDKTTNFLRNPDLSNEGREELEYRLKELYRVHEIISGL